MLKCSDPVFVYRKISNTTVPIVEIFFVQSQLTHFYYLTKQRCVCFGCRSVLCDSVLNSIRLCKHSLHDVHVVQYWVNKVHYQNKHSRVPYYRDVKVCLYPMPRRRYNIFFKINFIFTIRYKIRLVFCLIHYLHAIFIVLIILLLLHVRLGIQFSFSKEGQFKR